MKKTAHLREELHDYINRADERMLRIIHAILEADVQGAETLSQAENEELDRRRERHRKGLSASYTPQQIRARLEGRS